MDIFRNIGIVSVICGLSQNSPLLRTDVSYCSFTLVKSFWTFVFFFKFIKNSTREDLILFDNRKAALVGLLFLPLLAGRTVIYDMRELYRCESSNSLRNKIGTYIESCFLRFVDLVLCASVERVKLVRFLYKLRAKLVAIENNRRMDPGIHTMLSQEVVASYEEAIAGKNRSGRKVNFVSTDGFSEGRRSVDIIEACAGLRNDVNLFIFGKNQREAKTYIAENSIDNVFHLGAVDGHVLGSLLRKMDVGIVAYGSGDLNNKYCASGKIYEFLHLGIPVVTSDNPPLRKFTRNTGAGVSNENIRDGIIEIMKKLDRYKQQCDKFSRAMRVSDFEQERSKEILNYLRNIER